MSAVNIHSTPFWESVKRIKATVLPPGDAHILTLNADFDNADHGAPTVEASREVAARLLAQKTHRLSSAEEIAKFHSEQKKREAECRAQSEMQEKQRTRLALPDDLLDLLRGGSKKNKKGDDGNAS